MNTTAIACDLSKLDSAGRMREQELLQWVQTTIQEAVEVEDGYQLSFSSDPLVLSKLGEFIALERLCCPFLVFELRVNASSPALLRVTGPQGTKEFVASLLSMV